jgi:beta-xylosidase
MIINEKLKLVMHFFLLSLLLFANVLALKADSGNGDGTYTSPVVAADFPDPDVILVDDTYYMITTRTCLSPGVTILKSYDLANWEYCCNAAQRMDYSPCHYLDGCSRYGHGHWASRLKYYNCSQEQDA